MQGVGFLPLFFMAAIISSKSIRMLIRSQDGIASPAVIVAFILPLLATVYDFAFAARRRGIEPTRFALTFGVVGALWVGLLGIELFVLH